MIRLIAAIDSKRGIATDDGIPWYLPKELEYYRKKTSTGTILMGYGTYMEFDHPFHNRTNYVAVPESQQLKSGFVPVIDVVGFLKRVKEDVWIIGGAVLFESTIDLADKLYLTEIDQDFNCTKFFPPYKHRFKLIWKSEPQHENGLTYRFCIYGPKQAKA